MKQQSLFLACIFAILSAAGQDRKDLALSFSTGLLNSPYYEKARPRSYYRVDFDYHLSARHVLTAHYLAGKHNYYDDLRSNEPGMVLNANGTNSDAAYTTFAILYKYSLVHSPRLRILPGAGAGIVTHTLEYPYRWGNVGSYNTVSWSDLVFPVSLEVNYALSRSWRAGLVGGFLIHPDYPVLALHAGPRLSYVIR